jgi:hypothetical protein
MLIPEVNLTKERMFAKADIRSLSYIKKENLFS